MAVQATAKALREAFIDRPDIAQGLQSILDRSPFDATTLSSLANYVISLKSASTNGVSSQQTKKRKLDGDGATLGGTVLFDFKDISFSVPVRKKLRLEGLIGGIRGSDAQGNTEVNLGWESMEYVFCLPVPDRAKPQHNFVVIPHSTGSTVETIVWTAPEPNPKIPQPQESVETMANKLNAQLAEYGKEVQYPIEDDFVSRTGPKGGKVFGVRAHRGTKEGHIFFLRPGILFAFKKPLIFIPFHTVESVSYTSVLQRTFNLNIAVREENNDIENEIEFGMIDQEAYAGIDRYIKKHGLNDASLAASRRAKVYGVNAPKKAAGDAEGAPAQNGTAATGEEEEETEIQKAERLLQDQEDEEEEDYVEEGDDDDEGSSVDEDYTGGDGEEGEDGDEDEEAEVEEEYDEEAGGYEDEDPMEES